MKAATAGFISHLAGNTTTLATCWRIERQDGIIFRFTDHDKDLVIGGDGTYTTILGYRRRAIRTTSNLAVDELSLEGPLDALGITEADIRNGLYDYALFRIFTVNWADLSQGQIKLRKGWLGEISRRRNVYQTELRGLMQALSRQIIELYTVDCLADLGDTRCAVALGPFTVTGSVTSVISSQHTFRDSTRTEADQFFQFGLLTWTSGPNNGRKHEVKSYLLAGGQFELALPTFATIAVGNTYSVYAGCDKARTTCITKFNNLVNFRGFGVFIPGLDKILRTPDAT